MAHWPYYGGFGPTLVGVIWALFAVSTLQILGRLVAMNILTRRRGGLTNRRDRWSLLFACLAWLLATVSNIIYTYCMRYGLGNDAEQFVRIPTPIFSRAVYIEWIAANLVCYSSFFGRLSAALFMFCILGPTHKLGRWAISSVVAVNGLTYLVTTAMIYTQCDPPAKLWRLELPGNCDGEARAYKWAVFTGSWSAFADTVIALYPVYVLYQLQMRLLLKLLVSGLMGLGLFAAVCSVMKTVMLKNLNGTGIAHLMIWGAVEMWVVLIASSFAPLQPMFREWTNKVKAMSSTYLASSIWYQNISGSFSSSKNGRVNSNEAKNANRYSTSQTSTMTGDMPRDTIEKHTSFEVRYHERSSSDVEAPTAQTRSVTPWQ